MSDMMKEYGAKKGKAVYYGTEARLRSEGKLAGMLAKAKKHKDLVAKM